MVQHSAKLAVHVVEVICLLIALGLVSNGSGTCIFFELMNQTICGAVSISEWRSDLYASTINGQYFVFFSTIVLLVASCTTLVFVCRRLSKEQAVLCVDAFGIVLCVVNGGLEAWYASGAWMNGYSSGWAAASAFYFISGLCFCISCRHSYTSRTNL